ncbi:hypothetical protein [Streptomyces sp. NPDC056669]|uniref:hypothetical protein n=1 Tax=Streptomyces sp. NPDC056669 TaxID=3345903 RepID=UPI00369E2EB3
MRELLGPGRTLHFHATDTAPEVAAEWVVDLTGDAITWRRAHEKAAVAVRGPLTDLLLIIYKRRPARSAGVEILGDEKLLDFWRERVSFGCPAGARGRGPTAGRIALAVRQPQGRWAAGPGPWRAPRSREP